MKNEYSTTSPFFIVLMASHNKKLKNQISNNSLEFHYNANYSIMWNEDEEEVAIPGAQPPRKRIDRNDEDDEDEVVIEKDQTKKRTGGIGLALKKRIVQIAKANPTENLNQSFWKRYEGELGRKSTTLLSLWKQEIEIWSGEQYHHQLGTRLDVMNRIALTTTKAVEATEEKLDSLQKEIGSLKTLVWQLSYQHQQPKSTPQVPVQPQQPKSTPQVPVQQLPVQPQQPKPAQQVPVQPQQPKPAQQVPVQPQQPKPAQQVPVQQLPVQPQQPKPTPQVSVQPQQVSVQPQQVSVQPQQPIPKSPSAKFQEQLHGAFKRQTDDTEALRSYVLMLEQRLQQLEDQKK